jgi:hypothetical protein
MVGRSAIALDPSVVEITHEQLVVGGDADADR